MLQALMTPPPEPAVNEAEFRAALRQFASGVTVISTRDETGATQGMTATAFCSLSLRPPLVLVAVARGARCHKLILAEQRFGVGILRDDQAGISRHFGGQRSMDFKPGFGTLDGVPVLDDAFVKLSCRLESAMEGGDHSIFVGLVTALEIGEGNPLLHFDGKYHGVAPFPGG